MAKRTHHTNCNQAKKNYRNGIKKPRKGKLIEKPGINQKRMMNVLCARYYQKQQAK